MAWEIHNRHDAFHQFTSDAFWIKAICDLSEGMGVYGACN